MVELNFRDCHSFVDSYNFTNIANSHPPKVELHTRPKLCHLGRYVAKAKLFCLKNFVPVTGWSVQIVKCSSWLTRSRSLKPRSR